MRFQILLQSYDIQNSEVLVKKGISQSMEENRGMKMTYTIIVNSSLPK